MENVNFKNDLNFILLAMLIQKHASITKIQMLGKYRFNTALDIMQIYISSGYIEQLEGGKFKTLITPKTFIKIIQKTNFNI